MLMRKAGLKSHNVDATAGDECFDGERKMYTRSGEKEPGFPSSVVPTLEEKIVNEKRPKHPANGKPLVESLEESDSSTTVTLPNGDARTSESSYTMHNGYAPNGSGKHEDSANVNQREPHQAQLETGELYGAPADASVDEKHDDQPPHARAGKTDADEEEEKAPGARSLLRKHLTAKLGNKQWQLPTPAPNVDPYGFEDPISDHFWKDVWVASAVHNVSHI